MFNFTFKDIIIGILSAPFVLIKKSFKSAVEWTEDNEMMDKLYDLMEEVELFAIMFNKGPTELRKYRINNSPFEIHISFYYLSELFEEKNRLGFIIKRDEDKITILDGGMSAAGGSYMIKNDIQYEEIAKKFYLAIERAYIMDKSISMSKVKPKWMIYGESIRQWKEEIIFPIVKKYGFEDQYYALRRALIMSSHDENHSRYVKAKEELMLILNNEEQVLSFALEIKDNYNAKMIYDKLIDV